MHRAWAAWRGYWLAPGGRISAAALRIAVALALLWTLYRIGAHAPRSESARYFEHGIWLFYPGRPGAALVEALTVTAWCSTLLMLIGAWTRLSHAVSFVAVLALATLEVSGLATWTHQNVPPLLASMAMLGARTGDALSLDAWLARRSGRHRAPPADGYQWSVRLVQVAVASVFFVAGVCKLKEGGLSLGWALSDNLRHQLLMRFDWIDLQRTPAAEWMLGAAWRYRTFACLNLISQLTPIAAVFLLRRPGLRAAVGVVWIAEVLGLGFVMALWDTHWLPLAAAFVDWDALVGAPPDPLPAPPPPRARSRVLGYVTLFVVFYAVQAFWLNQRLRLYPFSSYPMFSTVRAKPPFDRHQTYELVGGRIELDAPSVPAEVQTWLAHRIQFRWMWRERDPARVRRDLEAILVDTRRQFPDLEPTRVRLWLVVDQAPAYPAPAQLERHDLALIGELDTRGTFRCALGTLDGLAITVESPHVDLAGARLLAIRNDQPTPLALDAHPTPRGFALEAPITADPAYVVVETAAGEHWLVTQRSSRGF